MVFRSENLFHRRKQDCSFMIERFLRLLHAGSVNMSQAKKDLGNLSPMQFKVTQEKYTERPFTGRFNEFKEQGTYMCVVCGQELFRSNHKFESGCGWPAFFDSIDPKLIKEVRDESLGMSRTEVLCANCDSHLGHVFNDGPKPTRRRFCINSVSLKFVAANGETFVDEGKN